MYNYTHFHSYYTSFNNIAKQYLYMLIDAPHHISIRVIMVIKYWDLVLTDIDGTSNVVKHAGIADNIGMYKIVAASPGTYTFYVDWSGTTSFKFEKFSLQKTGGGTMSCNVLWKINGTYGKGGLSEAYDTDPNLVFDATQAARWNTIDIEQICYGVPVAVECVISAAGTIFAQALRS